MPLAYGVAAAAPLDTAAASTSTVTTLLARDPTATTLDNAMFGLGKGVGSRAVAGPPYRPLDAQVIPRFAGIRTFMRAPHVTELAGVDAVVYGIPFDTATSYRTGARFGPEAIRSASSLLRPYNPALAVNVVDALSIVDYGDLPVSPGDTERTYAQVEEALAPIVDAGAFAVGARRRPLDHARRAARARAQARADGARAARLARRRVGAVLRAAVLPRHDVQASRRRGAARRGSVGAGGDARLALRRAGHRGRARPRLHRALDRRAARPRRLRSTASSCARRRATGRCSCRSTSISSTRRSRPGPARPRWAASRPPRRSRSCARCAASQLVGCDVVEVSPPYDGPGMVTALAGATVVYELLSLRALARDEHPGLPARSTSTPRRRSSRRAASTRATRA